MLAEVTMRALSIGILALGLAAGVSADAPATPTITSASGTVAHGSDVSVSGAGFGTKPQAAPYIWDPMDTSLSSSWVHTGNLTIQSTDTRHPNSSGQGFLDMDEYNHSNGSVQAPNNPLSDTWFAQYWVYFGSDFNFGTSTYGKGDTFLSNMKVFRLWNPGGGVTENFCVVFAGWARSFSWACENAGQVGWISGITDRLTLGQWHLLQFAFKENSGLGVGDGKFQMWLDGESLDSRTDLVTRLNFAGLKRPLLIGWFNMWGPTAGEDPEAPNTYRIDDVYLDTSWARVEIGNAATYAASTHREIQLPQSWADDQVLFRVNQGAFADGATAYLYVIDADGRVNGQGFPITINAVPVIPPVAAFTATPTTGTAPLPVSFTDHSTNTPTSWSWSFGDGGSATTQHPSHTYATAGSYTVALTAANAGGSNTRTSASYITVTAPVVAPVAAFAGTPATGTAPLPVSFTDQSTNTPTSWSWDFGDGTTGTTQNPGHTYATAGSYTVALTAANTGGSNTRTSAAYITVAAPVPAPVAAFVGTPTSGTVPLPVSFTDQSTNTPTSWSWDLGDGTTVTAQHPVHTYATAGTYTVALTATNAGGSNTKTNNAYVTVTALVAVPLAAFTAAPRSGVAPLSVSFTDQSTNAPTSWSWTFGDGGTATTQNPGHSYATAGTYTVTLTAANAAGSNTITSDAYVTVTAPVVTPVAVFEGTPTSGAAPLAVSFTDQSTNAPTSWSWTFGDRSTATSQNPSHTFISPGTYTVALTATNAAGSNRMSRTAYVTVTAPVVPPVAAFTAAPTSGVAPLAVQLTDRSTNTPTSWSWSFGDGGTSTTQSPRHTYTAAGTYTVALTATNTAGSSSKTNIGYITVTLLVVAPVAAFTGMPTAGVAPLAVTFTDQSANTPTSWSWSFGDGSVETTQNPGHTYATAGTYTVALTATNIAGSNTKTSTAYVTVTTPVVAPVTAFVGAPLTGVAPLEVSFTDQSTNTPTSWSWNFGDGNTGTTQHPSHTYAMEGTYTVALTATNAGGSNTRTSAAYVTVAASIVAPVAAFTGAPLAGMAPLEVHFTDQSTNMPTSWSWDLGDGSTETTQNPSHTYRAGGSYTVTLTAANAGGFGTETRQQYISVITPPPPDDPPPAAVRDLAVAARGAGFIELRWTAVGEDSVTGSAAGYEIRARLEGQISTPAEWNEAPPAPFPAPLPLPAGDPMTARWEGIPDSWSGGICARARDANGRLSAFVPGVSVPAYVPPPPPPAAPPPPVTHLAVDRVDTRSATMELRHPTPVLGGLPIAGYSVAVSRSPIVTETWASADTSAPGPGPGPPDSVVAWVITGLEPSTLWSVAVRTRDIAGRLAGLSPVVSFRTLAEEEPAPPSPPDAPEAEWSGAGDILLITWPPSSDPRVSGYRVYGRTATGMWEPLGGLVPTGNRVEAPREAVSRFFAVAVTVVISDGTESALSPERAIPGEVWKVEGPFPQPITDGCTVIVQIPPAFPSGSALRVEILDLLGRRLATLHEGSATAGTRLELAWNRLASGSRVGPGYHYLRVEASGYRLLRTIYLAP
jgi:PKD repeat protein